MPVHLAIHSTRRQLFVSMPQIDAIGVWDLTTRRWCSPIRIRGYPGFVRHIPKKDLLVAANYNASSVSIVSMAGDRPPTTIPVDYYPRVLACSQDEVLLITLNYHAGTIGVIELERAAASHVTHIEVGTRASDGVFLADGYTAIVVDRLERSCTAVNVASSTILGRGRLAAEPRSVVGGRRRREAYVLCPRDNSVVVVDENGSPSTCVKTGETPIHHALLSDGETLVVLNARSRSLTAIDTLTRKTITTIPVGQSPLRVFEAPEMGLIVVLNRGDKTASLIDASTFDLLGVAPTGAGAYSVCADAYESTLYVSNEESFSITAIALDQDSRRLKQLAKRSEACKDGHGS